MQIKTVATSWTKWDRFIRRWGVSFLIDNDILFDVFGKPSYLQKQIMEQSIDVSKIKYIVLSHKDWDHVSGLWNILPKCSAKEAVNVYICCDFEEEFKQKIKSYNVNLVETKGVLEIRKDVFIISGLTGIVKDKLIHEQFLVLKTNKGLVMITGCAHPGIENIVKWVKNCFNNDLYMIVGGFHLKDKNKQETDEIVKKLKVSCIKKIAPTHCTGSRAVKVFKENFEDNFIDIKKQSIIQI
jgi:7,8-dihydropterin-6-yl-methyl-4-(beta-D-ribofuranosyl)aminobenzene 5'-phosphate synthase